MAARNINEMTSQTATFGCRGPPRPWRANQPTNAPIMYTSPWAKFRSLRIP